jgi:hypothetical protein
MSLVFEMSGASYCFGKKLNFRNFTFEVFPGLSVGIIFAVAFLMTIFYVVLFAYVWPLKINPDPEYPAPWYYPVSCKYWR